ncbi:MAG: hypothetical protein ABI664_10500 [bacterium]
MSERDEVLVQQQRLVDRYDEAAALLRQLPGVVGVGVGARERRGELVPELAYRVYVAEKIEEALLPESYRVPRDVFGMRTDVIVSPDVDLISSSSSAAFVPPPRDTTKYRPLQGGGQMRTATFEGDNNRGMGTLGCLAMTNDGKMVALTCQHVACAGTEFNVGAGAGSSSSGAPTNFACVGVKVGQPRHVTCCCCCTYNEIGAVLRAQNTAQIDCAIVELDSDAVNDVTSGATINQVVGVGTLTGVAQAVCFSAVSKRGSSTGLTRGTVVDVLYEGSQILINPLPGFQKFAFFGDSGAVIVDSAGKVVGLLWGADRGTTNRGVANHIGPVLVAMGIKIAGDAGTGLGIPTTSCGSSSSTGTVLTSSSSSSGASDGSSSSSSSSESSSSSSSSSSDSSSSSSDSLSSSSSSSSDSSSSASSAGLSGSSSTSSSSSSAVPATIEIVRDHNNRHLVDQTSPTVNFVRVGLWDHAYDAAFAVRNGPAEVNNFVGSDTRRFYFRVTDPSNPNPQITIDWRTVGTNADSPAVKSLTLRETVPGSHIYVSRAVMVVIMTEDRDFQTDSGLNDPAADLRAAGQSDHRTRRCAIDGSAVRGDYTPFGAGTPIFAAVPIFRRLPDERRRVACSVINYGTNAAVAHIAAQFADANLLWNQLGIQIDAGATVNRPVPAAALDVGGDYPGGLDSAEEQAALADLLPITADGTLTVVFVRLSGGQNAYTTVFERVHSALGNRSFIFVSHNVAETNLTLAHELHHALFNRGDDATDQPLISFNTHPPDSFAIALPDVRVEHRFHNLHSPDPDNDPTSDNVLNWARRVRTTRFPIPGAFDAPNTTTGNTFAAAF